MSFRCSDQHYSCQSIQHLSTEGNDKKVTCYSVGFVVVFLAMCNTRAVQDKFQKKTRAQTASYSIKHATKKLLGKCHERKLKKKKVNFKAQFGNLLIDPVLP